MIDTSISPSVILNTIYEKMIHSWLFGTYTKGYTNNFIQTVCFLICQYNRVAHYVVLKELLYYSIDRKYEFEEDFLFAPHKSEAEFKVFLLREKIKLPPDGVGRWPRCQAVEFPEIAADFFFPVEHWLGLQDDHGFQGHLLFPGPFLQYM